MPTSLLAGLTARLQRLRYGFLAVPGTIALVFAAAAVVTGAVDRSYDDGLLGIGVEADADAARAVLATIAGSLVTVAGLTFSITIVSLQLVSQQFSPRALRGFLGDRITQAVAGSFVGIFLFCVLVLRTIKENDVPVFGLTTAVAFAVAALALLLVFIHHMAHSIQVSTIAAGVAQATMSGIEELYPSEYGDPVERDPAAVVAAWTAERQPTLVYAERPGYVQSVDHFDRTIGGAHRLHLRVAPGDFVGIESPVAAVWSDGDDDCAVAVRRGIAVANERDIKQDVDYGLRQLADIAIRALSPSVNDPTTACTCIGYIGAIMARLASRSFPPRVRATGEIEIVARERTFEELCETAFVQVGRYAIDARVVAALVAAIGDSIACARAVGADGRVATLVATAERVVVRALAEQQDEYEREAIEQRVRSVTAAR